MFRPEGLKLVQAFSVFTQGGFNTARRNATGGAVQRDPVRRRTRKSPGDRSIAQTMAGLV